MNTDTAVLVSTDASFDAAVGPVAKSQYQFRDFSFWNEATVERSVNRYAQSLSFSPTSAHDSELAFSGSAEPLSDFLRRSNRRNEPELRLPAIFQKRVIGERSVSTLQEWECVVSEVTDETVYALATSVIAREPDQNYIEIPLEEFQPSDRGRLRTGILFRLIIGFVTKANGRRAREAILYIRHQLPRSEKQLEPLIELLNNE